MHGAKLEESEENAVEKIYEEMSPERAACTMIVDIGYDRDGYKSAEDLGGLIDELVEFARAGLRGEHPGVFSSGELDKCLEGIKNDILFEKS